MRNQQLQWFRPVRAVKFYISELVKTGTSFRRASGFVPFAVSDNHAFLYRTDLANIIFPSNSVRGR
jgi:hypothetical protein